MNGRGEQDFVVLLYRQSFEGLDNFRKEVVGDLRNNQSEDAASSGNQRTRLPVGIIAEFFDGFPDTLSKLRVHGGNLIDGTRHRRCRNSCPPCNVTDIHEGSSTLKGYRGYSIRYLKVSQRNRLEKGERSLPGRIDVEDSKNGTCAKGGGSPGGAEECGKTGTVLQSDGLHGKRLLSLLHSFGFGLRCLRGRIHEAAFGHLRPLPAGEPLLS